MGCDRYWKAHPNSRALTNHAGDVQLALMAFRDMFDDR